MIVTSKYKESNRMEVLIKRITDMIGATLGIIIMIPLTILIAIAKVISKDNGPVFYCQMRVGMNGKLFKMYKYRSMIIDADKKLNAYLAENKNMKDEYDEYKKLQDDPRVTKIGKFIRKTNIDEFPQFINVLKGDMSLVGPRPYLYQEIKDMGEYYKDIISCKPGITGLWQIDAKNNRTFRQRLEVDKSYLSKHDLKADIKILLKTLNILNQTKKYGKNVKQN